MAMMDASAKAAAAAEEEEDEEEEKGASGVVSYSLDELGSADQKLFIARGKIIHFCRRFLPII